MILLVYASQWAAKQRHCPEIELKKDILESPQRVKHCIIFLLKPLVWTDKFKLEVICGLEDDDDQKARNFLL